MNFIEDVKLSGVRKTSEGYLVGNVNCARTGIQSYSGDEVGKPEIDIVSVYRSEEEVFAKDSLKTLAGKPLTNDHPDDFVTPENWKEHAVGLVGSEILRNGDKIRVPVMLMDADTIKQVEQGKRELSNGYTMDLVWEDGVTPDGQKYQAKQTNIRMNHVAIVDRGRAGHECRVGDNSGKWGASPIILDKKEEAKVTIETKKVLVDGLTVETTEQGAQAIDKLKNQLETAKKEAVDAGSVHKERLASKDTELAQKDAEIDKLKAQLISDEEIDKRVEARAKLIADASLVLKDFDFSGVSEKDIKKKVVQSKLGNESISDKSNEYIDARFEIIIEDYGNGDDFSSAFKKSDQAYDKSKDNGQSSYEQRTRDGWKTAGVE